MHKTLQQSLKTGWVVIGLLGVLTVIEFAVAMSTKDALLLALLLVAALVKAWLIIQYFMHFGQLWPHIRSVWYGVLIDDADED